MCRCSYGCTFPHIPHFPTDFNTSSLPGQNQGPSLKRPGPEIKNEPSVNWMLAESFPCKTFEVEERGQCGSVGMDRDAMNHAESPITLMLKTDNGQNIHKGGTFHATPDPVLSQEICTVVIRARASIMALDMATQYCCDYSRRLVY